MNVNGSCVLCYHMQNKTTQALSIKITDIERSVLPSCADILTLRSVLASDKLDKMNPSGAKLVISQADRFGVFTINKKTNGNIADQWINMKPQPSTINQANVHIREDPMHLDLDCSLVWVNSRTINTINEVELSVPFKKTPYRAVLIHQQAASKQQFSEMQVAGIITLVDHNMPWINSYVIINKKQLDNCGISASHILGPIQPQPSNAQTAFLLQNSSWHFSEAVTSQHFTIVDFSKNYHRITLDEASSFLKTLILHLANSGSKECHLAWLWKKMHSSES